MTPSDVDRKALERLKADHEREESAKWEEVARRRRKQVLRTSSIGAGMCLLVGLLLGANFLFLVPCAVLFAGGAAWLAIRLGLESMTAGIVLGTGAAIAVVLSGGRAIYAPVLCVPLGMAVFIGHKGETEMG